MGFLKRIQNKLELTEVEAENREFAKKFGKSVSSKNIPAMYTGNMRDDKIVKEIKGTATGETVAFEREDGSWIWAGTDHHLVQKDENGRPFVSSTKSPLTKEFEAQKAMSYPVFNGVSGL
jgi:tRNA U54 and U55 pseudouridine synthase Pus10